MAQQPPLLSRMPTHRLYRVLGDGQGAIWTPIGAAWPNKDGQGFSIICDAVPLHGRIVMRTITERTEETRGQQ
ncbi:hypothetical protein QO010_004012 [Caulobacter ginsengisoli]|uniref:Uncharacterized protein n=1 Tax=Caulobacter ginsengisoli TaxID=400775 RepID=A0ABU0IW31_9CAUL|nr:hypothetical protein [Caulobacter ginsengisoli]MDQ0466219.1 hypothetical protein [Caulobacter ginsengisoli]